MCRKDRLTISWTSVIFISVRIFQLMSYLAAISIPPHIEHTQPLRELSQFGLSGAAGMTNVHAAPSRS